MKKLFITVLLLITCIGSIIANCHHLRITYADENNSVCDYYANHNDTDIQINTDHTKSYYLVYDWSWYDDARAKSREDFNKIYSEIMASHSDAVHDYVKSDSGQHIEFYKDKVKKLKAD